MTREDFAAVMVFLIQQKDDQFDYYRNELDGGDATEAQLHKQTIDSIDSLMEIAKERLRESEELKR